MIFLKLSLQPLNLSLWDHFVFVPPVFLGKFSLLFKTNNKQKTFSHLWRETPLVHTNEVTVFRGPLVFMVVNSPDLNRRPTNFSYTLFTWGVVLLCFGKHRQ